MKSPVCTPKSPGICRCLRVGSIERTSYEENFFDIVTCNASMSYWDNPVSCFDEIYRILRPGGGAYLFEPQKDIDVDQMVETINENLAGESPIRRLLAVSLNKFAYRRGLKVGLNLYRDEELEALAARSKFAGSGSIEKVMLQNLPIFFCINLIKPDETSKSTLDYGASEPIHELGYE